MARSEQARKNQMEYIKKYKKQHYIAYTIRFNKDSDKDIIDFLNNSNDKTDLIRKLIKEKIESLNNLLNDGFEFEDEK